MSSYEEGRIERPLFGGWYWLVPIVALAAMRGFWAPDEPRYAQIAKEAWDTGSFVVLHVCGELYPDKPPLVFWMSGLMGKLTGWSEFWMRVPSILATIGSAWLCARIARRWLGERAAAWSVAFYLGTAMVFEIGGRLQLDPTLSFFSLAALALLIDDEGGAGAVLRRTLLAGVCLGLGALAKGPVAWLPVGFAIVLFWILPRPFRFAPRRALVAWIGFVVLALLPVTLWAWVAIREEPLLAKHLLFGQHVGRISKGDQHPGPIWDHARSLPALLLPWTFLFVAGAIAAWKSFRARTDPGLVRIAAWFALVFVFFSIIPPKRDLYLLPIYPAAAMIAAFAFDKQLGAGRSSRWIAVPTAAVILLVGVALAAAPLFVSAFASEGHLMAELNDPGRYARLCVPPGLILVVAGVVALAAFARSRPKLWADAIGVGLACSLTVAAFGLVPAVDEDKCARRLAHLVARRPERPTVLACLGVRPEGIRFYGGGPAGGVVSGKTSSRALSIEDVLERDGPNFLALCRDREFESLPPDLRARMREVSLSRVGGRRVHVLVSAAP